MFTVEANLTVGMYQSHISFFVYTFWKMLNPGKKLIMACSDFHYTQSGHRGTAELSLLMLYLERINEFLFP